MKNGDVVWVVGKGLDGPDDWEFGGVFITREEAIAACNGPEYFIGPATVGVALPHEKVEWEGAYYPLAQGVPQ